MTRKEKINQLNDIFAEINEDDNAVCYLTSEDNELIESAIEALEQEPQTFEWCTDCREYDQEKHCCHRWSKVIRNTVEEMKQTCKDAISREDAMSMILCYGNEIKAEVMDNIKASMIKLPPVHPKIKTGHWISYWDEEARCHVYKCPECGNKQPFDTKCCWECGTRLVEPQESEG